MIPGVLLAADQTFVWVLIYTHVLKSFVIVLEVRSETGRQRFVVVLEDYIIWKCLRRTRDVIECTAEASTIYETLDEDIVSLLN